MPAPKKVWIPDGSINVYSSVFHEDSVHGGLACDACHGGNPLADNRAAGHSGSFAAIPLASACEGCHVTVGMLTDDALHTTLAGYRNSLEARGFDFDDPLASARYDEQCTKCHTADDDLIGDTRSACGQCHVSVPATAGGGLIAGHAFQRTPSMVNNCTACHGSRVKDEYYGLNNDLLARNRAALPIESPWADAGYTLQPDVHKEAGKDCVFCHSGGAIHGVRAPTDAGRYRVGSAPACEDCHGGPGDTAFDAVSMHQTEAHIDRVACQVCHSQPYKNCFECHTDVTSEGVAFYRINQGNPYWDSEGSAAPDALMTFRVGRNPNFDKSGTEKEFVVLRHVPIDSETFAYTGDNNMPGLVPDVTARSTWFPATPHNIRRTTPITSSCDNCHDAEASKYWLTDPIDDAYGWISPENEADEEDANADLITK